MKKILFLILLTVIKVSAQTTNPLNSNTKFEQLGTQLPTPNSYRTASGAPGKDYFQNKADYDIKAELDDANQKIIGSEILTYTNFSPDGLKYLWMQLDQNIFKSSSINALTTTKGISPSMSAAQLNGINDPESVNSTISGRKEYGYKIKSVTDIKNSPLKYTINGTMMRIDLPAILTPNISTQIKIEWEYNITSYYGRSGYEFFEKDGNYNYFISHWFPRMCVYDDVSGWQNKQFLGQGEFTLPFGDYKVEITVPADHLVAATGECQNYAKVLTKNQLSRLQTAATSKTPVMIANAEEADERMKSKSTQKQTWVYTAKKVRDFAFASSRRFIWDAMQSDVYSNGKKVWCM
ncbi:MAG: M1 family peptidase, partial [Leadbetterella sp.]